MSQSKVTLIGLKNYLAVSGDDLFLNLTFPTGIDKDDVITNILMRGGEFEVLYPDPYFIKSSLVTWSKKWHWTFKKWYDAINIEYNPLENYDRTETGTDTSHDTGESSSTHSDTRTDNLNQNISGGSSDNVTINENTVSAYGSLDYVPQDKNTQSQSTNLTTTNTGTQAQTGSYSGESDVNSSKNHNWRIHGNIGVTTSQQMLQSEIDIAMFNLYDKIADVFLQEYVIPIY